MMEPETSDCSTKAHLALNSPQPGQKRVVIAGAGFAGLKLAVRLARGPYQVVLIDSNNFHQFQPLYYQVATAGLEPSAISFPLRKIFQHSRNVFIRVTTITGVLPDQNCLLTELGGLPYDILVICTGVNTNFFGLQQIAEYAIPMKSVSEALAVRNRILQNFEDALTENNGQCLSELLNIVVVGGGPTGVEVSGTLAEMKKYILPKDYPEIDFNQMHIYLAEAGGRLLSGMTEQSSAQAEAYLKKLGVEVLKNTQVADYDGHNVALRGHAPIPARTLVWAAGVTAKQLPGIASDALGRGNRMKVDRYNKVIGYDNIYALGDVALMQEPAFPEGHPQMAQPAIQQAKNLARNLKNQRVSAPLVPFSYRDKGSMATIGRNLAVVDLPLIHFHGFFAWLTWMFVHLMAIVGIKNRLLIFINWFWNYVTYDQSLRLIIKPEKSRPGAP